MVDVRFELTTNDPWSVDDAICEGISPLGYWQKVNQSPTQTKLYNTLLPFRIAGFLVFVWGRTCLLRSSFFIISGDPGRMIYQILDMRKFTFL